MVPSRIRFHCATTGTSVFIFLTFNLILLFVFLPFLGLFLWHMEVPRLGVELELQTSVLHQNHSNAGSEPCLQPTPQLTATPDRQPTEQGQGLNPQPHGS